MMMMKILLAVLAIAMIVTEAKPRFFSRLGSRVQVHTTDYPVGDPTYTYKGLVCVEEGLYDSVS